MLFKISVIMKTVILKMYYNVKHGITRETGLF